MKNGEMQENIVRKYTYQMLKGCEYLHKHKVIHRDIKGTCIPFHSISSNFFTFALLLYHIYCMCIEQEKNLATAKIINTTVQEVWGS